MQNQPQIGTDHIFLYVDSFLGSETRRIKIEENEPYKEYRSVAAVKRLMKDWKELLATPFDGISVQPYKDNLFWYFF